MPPFSLTKGQESRTDGAPETPLNDERFRALYDTYLQQGYSVDDAAMAAEQAVAAASPDAQEARRREEAQQRKQAAMDEAARIRYAEDLGMDFDAAQGMDLDEMRVRARFAKSRKKRDQRDYARDQITTRAQYRATGVPMGVAMLPQGERSDAIRQLLPRAPGGISDLEAAKLGLDRADIDARMQQSDQNFQAQMQQMRNEAERDRIAAEERRKQWEERFNQTDRIADDERRDRKMARKDAKKAREAEREEKAADRTSREGQPAREMEARSTLDERARESEMEAEERAEERTLANAQRDADVKEYGTGVLAIMAGNYNTPAALDSFQKIADKSDKTWGGFGEDSVYLMDRELARLGVSDPNYRRELIYIYGIQGRQWYPPSQSEWMLSQQAPAQAGVQ